MSNKRKMEIVENCKITCKIRWKSLTKVFMFFSVWNDIRARKVWWLTRSYEFLLAARWIMWWAFLQCAGNTSVFSVSRAVSACFFFSPEFWTNIYARSFGPLRKWTARVIVRQDSYIIAQLASPMSQFAPRPTRETFKKEGKKNTKQQEREPKNVYAQLHYKRYPILSSRYTCVPRDPNFFVAFYLANWLDTLYICIHDVQPRTITFFSLTFYRSTSKKQANDILARGKKQHRPIRPINSSTESREIAKTDRDRGPRIWFLSETKWQNFLKFLLNSMFPKYSITFHQKTVELNWLLLRISQNLTFRLHYN